MYDFSHMSLQSDLQTLQPRSRTSTPSSHQFLHQITKSTSKGYLPKYNGDWVPLNGIIVKPGLNSSRQTASIKTNALT